MKRDEEAVQSRNRFEAHLKDNHHEGYRLYIQVKKKALERGEDPMKAFANYIADGARYKDGQAALSLKEAREYATKFWLLAIGKRLVVAEEDDVQFLRDAMAAQDINFDMLVELLGGDRRKAADVICALHLDKLENVGHSSVYMMVDKLLRGKGRGGGRPPPIGRFFLDEIPENALAAIAGDVDALEILRKYGIEDWQLAFQRDHDRAMEDLEQRICEEKGPVKKKNLEGIKDYFMELDALDIPGIVHEIRDAKTGKVKTDPETGEPLIFPAVHQKIGARFIATKKRALIADEMGIGKTAQAIIAKNLIEKNEGRRITSVAVVPNHMLSHWERQIALWNSEGKSVLTVRSENKLEAFRQIEAMKDGKATKPDFILVSYDMVFRERGEKRGMRPSGIRDLIIKSLVSGGYSQKEAMEIFKAARKLSRGRDAYIAQCVEQKDLKRAAAALREASGKAAQEQQKLLRIKVDGPKVLGPDDDKQAKIRVAVASVFDSLDADTVGRMLGTVCDYLILDEVHNAKEAESFRSEEVMRLSKSSEYVVMLSGTPVPNRISDLGVVASILWNHKFTPDEFNRRYKRNARVVRELILPMMLRRRKEGTFGARRCERHVIPIGMSDAQMREHERLELNADGRDALGLLAQLRRCALDPRLVGIEEDSKKYAALIENLKEHAKDGSPAVVFSSKLKEGVLGKLCSMLEAQGFRTARVDGDRDRSGKRRDWILEDFSNGEYDVLVATLETLGEGVDKLTRAHRGYFIDVPFSEAELAQGIARLDRQNQESDVDIYIFVSENSIDELLLDLIEQKKILGEFLIDGMELTDFEKRIIEDAEKLVECGEDPLRKLYRHFGKMKNRETAQIVSVLQDEIIGMFIARQYWDNYEGSFYGNMMAMVSGVIRGMEAGGRRFDSVLDIASGTCCLARELGRPVVSLDANPYALAVGKEMLGEMAGETVAASFKKMPLGSGRFDLAVFSLGLLYSAPHEREAILREMSRVMRKDGIAILTLPSGEGKCERLAQVLPMLGFRVLPDATGTARGVGGPFEAMIITAVKEREPPQARLPASLFDFGGERLDSEGYEASVARTIKRAVCSAFEIDEVSVEEAGRDSAQKLAAHARGQEAREAAEADSAGGVGEAGLKRQAETAGVPEPITKLTIDQLCEKYGSPRDVYDRCPDAELEEAGAIVYKLRSGYGVARKDESDRKYRRFVRKFDPAEEKANGRRRLAG